MFKRKGNEHIDYLKEEIEILKRQLNSKNPINEKEIMELVKIASEMRDLLIQCRNQSLPVHLAKRIDSVLEMAKAFD